MNTRSPSRRNLGYTWLILVVLHFTILGIAHMPLHQAGMVIIVALALVQMILVLSIFMEIRHRTRLFWLVAAAGFFWLLIQWILTLGDYLTRQWH